MVKLMLLWQLFLFVLRLTGKIWRKFFPVVMGGPSPRSPQWPKVRAAFLAKHPRCAACGDKDKVVPHHVIPFRVRPDLELDENNLISLCEGSCNCHLAIGHSHDWRASNPHVRADAALMFKRVQERLYEPETP